jgi:ADP-ribose pyrophosphatase YjhB (NUDIX family)
MISNSEDVCFNSVNGIGTKIERIEDMGKTFDMFEKSNIPEFYVYTETPEVALNCLLEKNEFISAAGGIVSNADNCILLMNRLGYSDFPKGKVEIGETEISAARREIEEECGLNVEISNKIMDTYHVYHNNEKRIIKRTAWFAAEYYGNQIFTPQTEEGITDIRWVSIKSVNEHLSEMYASLRPLITKYLSILK